MILQKWLLTINKASSAPVTVSSNVIYAAGDNVAGELGINTVVSSQSYVQIGSSSWTQLAFGPAHTLAIRSDKKLFAWGLNTNGQLGDGTFTHRSSPVQIGSSNWTTISASDNNSYGITENNLLYGWGSTNFGQIGTGLQQYYLTGSSLSWSQLVSSLNYVVGIRSNGLLYAWGNNSEGQLGDNTTIHRSSPVQIGSSSWTQVSAFCNFSNVAAIRSDGRLFSWGNNTWGVITDFGTLHRSSPVQIGTSSWSQVSSGAGFLLAITSDNRLFSWGNNVSGQLGDNTRLHRSSPVQVGTSSWTKVSAAPSRALAIRSDGGLFSWGDAGFVGAMGTNDAISRSSPVQLGSSSWTQISAGSNGGLAITNNGLLFAWGFTARVVADNTNTDKSSPVQIGTSSWSQVSTSNSGSMAITSDGRLFGWGRNNLGQFGLGPSNLDTFSSPVQIASGYTGSWTQIYAGTSASLGISSQNIGYIAGVAGLNGVTLDMGTPIFVFAELTGQQRVYSPVQIGSSSWTQVSSNINTIFAIKSDSTLFGWGQNNNRNASSSNGNVLSPTQIGSSLWKKISNGGSFTLGIDNIDELYGWGNNSLLPITPRVYWDKISIGAGGYIMAIRSDKLLFAWGVNLFGQLGDNTSISRSSPVQIGTSSWTQVSAGSSYTLAIRSDGALFGWGQNAGGALGNNTTSGQSSSPVQIGTSSWTQVAATTGSVKLSAAIRIDGGLFVWGENGLGQVGDNTIIRRSSPVQIGTSSWTQVAMAQDTTFAIRQGGTLWSWGVNNTSGRNLSTGFTSSPIQIGTSSWSQIAARGGLCAAAITSTGSLFTWGTNSAGRLGDNTIINRSSPVQIGSGSWASVSCGESNMAAITNNKLFVWGAVGTGTIGDNQDTQNRSSPVQIGGGNWTSPSMGILTAAAVDSNLDLFVWGNNFNGEYGVDTNITSSSPVQLGIYYLTPQKLSNSSWKQISAGTSHSLAIDSTDKLYGWGNFAATPGNIYSWTQIATGRNHTLALRNDGALFTWGLNTGGLLGSNSVVHRSSPVQIGTSSWIQVAASDDMSGAIRSDSRLFTWGGQANYGSLGDNSTITRSSPVQIGTSSWTQIAMNTEGCIAIRSDKYIFTWGRNTQGQLGDNTIIARSSPVQIGSSSWTQVSTSAGNMAAIRNDGLLFTWGWVGGGALGDNQTLNNRSSPVQLGTSSWTQVSINSRSMSLTDFSFALAIRNDGALFAWGENPQGNLGTNDLISRSSPVQIGTSSWTQVAAVITPLKTSFAIRSDGALFGWGSSADGILGDNTVTAKSSPIQIGSSSWTQVKGSTQLMAIANNGVLFGWGNNSSGQIGDNTLIHRSSPVQIGSNSSYGTPNLISSITQIGASSYTQIAAGTNYSLAINIGNVLFQWGANDNLPIYRSVTNAGYSAVSIAAGQQNVGFVLKQ